MIVVDASVLVEVLLNSRHAERLADRIFVEGRSLHAPHLVDLEVAQAIRRYAATGALADERGGEALDDLVALPIRRYPHEMLLGRIWELRANATAYDAAYLALAEALDAPLLTRDTKLAGVPGIHAVIDVV